MACEINGGREKGCIPQLWPSLVIDLLIILSASQCLKMDEEFSPFVNILASWSFVSIGASVISSCKTFAQM